MLCDTEELRPNYLDELQNEMRVINDHLRMLTNALQNQRDSDADICDNAYLVEQAELAAGMYESALATSAAVAASHRPAMPLHADRGISDHVSRPPVALMAGAQKADRDGQQFGAPSGFNEDRGGAGQARSISSGAGDKVSDSATPDRNSGHTPVPHSHDLPQRLHQSDHISDRGPLLSPSVEELNEEIEARQLRMTDMDNQLFAEPAWDMILDLALADREGRHISVSSLCIASGVPETTALRLIQRLVDQGWLISDRDHTDRRRRLIGLSERGKVALAKYFAKIRKNYLCN